MPAPRRAGRKGSCKQHSVGAPGTIEQRCIPLCELVKGCVKAATKVSCQSRSQEDSDIYFRGASGGYIYLVTGPKRHPDAVGWPVDGVVGTGPVSAGAGVWAMKPGCPTKPGTETVSSNNHIGMEVAFARLDGLEAFGLSRVSYQSDRRYSKLYLYSAIRGPPK